MVMQRAFAALCMGALTTLAACTSTTNFDVRNGPQAQHPVTGGTQQAYANGGSPYSVQSALSDVQPTAVAGVTPADMMQTLYPGSASNSEVATAVSAFPSALPATASAFPVRGTDQVASRDRMPMELKSICLTHVGNPAAQERAFAADGGFNRGVVSAFSGGARYVSFVRRGVSMGGGNIASNSIAGVDGCSINKAGLTWTVLPDGRIHVEQSRAVDW